MQNWEVSYLAQFPTKEAKREEIARLQAETARVDKRTYNGKQTQIFNNANILALRCFDLSTGRYIMSHDNTGGETVRDFAAGITFPEGSICERAFNLLLARHGELPAVTECDRYQVFERFEESIHMGFDLELHNELRTLADEDEERMSDQCLDCALEVLHGIGICPTF